MEKLLITVEYGQVVLATAVYALVIAAYWKVMYSCASQREWNR